MPQKYQLKELYGQGQYEQVLAFWENPDERAQFTEWDFSYCMRSFYDLKRYQDCLEVYRACNKKYPECHLLDDKMGWSIYQTKVKPFDFEHGDLKTLFKQIDYVFSHSSDTQYSPKWFLAKFIADAVKEGKFGGEHNYALAIQYLDRVDPSTLDTEEQSVTDGSGKIWCFASKRESWYSYRTSLLLELKDYETCISCCDQAFEALHGIRFHSNNDSWILYRKAKCLQALNHEEEAKACIEQSLNRGFIHWCLLQMMFEFEAETGNEAKALSYAGACSLSGPDHEMRVKFYEELADYLERGGNSELPMFLRKLVLLLRAENGWKLKAPQTEWQLSEEIASMDKQTVLGKLTPVWREWRDKDKVFLTGTICKLLGEGKSGFISTDDGGNYYFAAHDIQSKNTKPTVGLKVRFTLVNKMDYSKDVVKPTAIDISIL